MGISRTDFLSALGVIKHGPQLDALTHRAYIDYELDVWKNGRGNPHGHPWHTSFHGSRFPGDPMACGRAAIYTLMDIPDVEPAPPMLRATAEMGKAAEAQILFRWRRAGIMIAGEGPDKDGDPGKQLQFMDEDTWLTGSIDAVLGIPKFPYVLPVDIKSKSKEVIDKMRTGAQSYSPEHYAQVQGYLYLCTKFYDTMDWAECGFAKPVGAVIYYVSRENPRHTHEFYVEIDWPFINNGLKNLEEWKNRFIAGTIPPRPKEWKWSEDPCKWCKFKKEACKPDNKDGVNTISFSHGVKFATRLNSTYDIQDRVKEVLNRWKV